VRNEVTDSALTELLYQLKRIRTEEVADSELTAAKGYLVGSFPLSIQTPQQIASQVANVKLMGLPGDYLQTYREKLAAVSAEYAKQAARDVIKTDSLAIVVVGDGRAVYDKLAAIAPVSIIDVDGNPLTPTDLSPEAVAASFDPAQVTARSDSFQVVLQGNPIGSLTLEITEEGAELVIRQQMAIAMAGLKQDETIRLDRATLAVLSREATGTMMGQTMETHLKYEGGRVTGTAQSPQPGGPKTVEVDTALAEGTVDSEALEALLFALPLAEGASITVNAFDASEGTVKPTTIKVVGVEELTVPAGTFSVFKVDLSGGAEAMTIYVTSDTPRRIVKMELAGQPVVMELVKGTDGDGRS
jgi:hypothetical protein